MLDCTGDIGLPSNDCIHQGVTEGEVGCDSRRKRAPCAMRVPRGDAGGLELGEYFTVEEQIDELIAFRVSSLDHDGRAASTVDLVGGGARVLDRLNPPAGQDLCLWDVGRHDQGPGEELSPKHSDAIII